MHLGDLFMDVAAMRLLERSLATEQEQVAGLLASLERGLATLSGLWQAPSAHEHEQILIAAISHLRRILRQYDDLLFLIRREITEWQAIDREFGE